jgi:elongation factor 1-beta
MSSKYNITDESHLTTLDAALKDNLYIGGHSPSAEDALVFEQFAQAKTEPNQDKHANLWAWFALVVLFRENVRDSWKASAKVAEKKPAEKKEEKKPEKKAAEPVKDECDDLFGDDGDDAAALEALKKKKEDEKKSKKKKEEVVQKSLVLLDVKVWDPEQDLDELAKRIIKIEKDGLFWKTEYKLADVAFGVKKIVVGMTIEDEKISVDDLIEELQGWEDDIQSVDIVAFNKI